MSAEALEIDMSDVFHHLPKATVKKVKEILLWAHKNGLRTDVDMLDCSKSIARTKADKKFDPHGH